MPNQEADVVDLLSARFFGKLDLLQGYRQMPLAEEAREIFTITTPAAWTEGRFKAWADAQDPVAHAVALHHPRPGCQV